jgi:myo-inositol catabolism protein IolC
MVSAITHLQGAGVEPDVWKIEGLDRVLDCQHIVEAVRRGGPRFSSKVACRAIVLLFVPLRR